MLHHPERYATTYIIVKAIEVTVEHIGKVKLGVTKSLSSSSELEGILYQALSLFSEASLEYPDWLSPESELEDKESSDWPSDKSGKSNRPSNVAMVKLKKEDEGLTICVEVKCGFRASYPPFSYYQLEKALYLQGFIGLLYYARPN